VVLPVLCCFLSVSGACAARRRCRKTSAHFAGMRAERESLEQLARSSISLGCELIPPRLELSGTRSKNATLSSPKCPVKYTLEVDPDGTFKGMATCLEEGVEESGEISGCINMSENKIVWAEQEGMVEVAGKLMLGDNGWTVEAGLVLRKRCSVASLPHGKIILTCAVRGSSDLDGDVVEPAAVDFFLAPKETGVPVPPPVGKQPITLGTRVHPEMVGMPTSPLQVHFPREVADEV